ncbi:ricin B lectin domain-containing protein [Favolaschia claudopus]|uniref:Ricin B lectin domain-containing protein n=1 Tax=Favolaschia claudopus TaxID=2862362 RepID=A0AAW0CWC1_9AGAR
MLAASFFSASILAAALSVNAQGPMIEIQTTLGSNKCLTASSLKNGAPVVIQDCGANSTTLNSWSGTGVPGGTTQLSANGFCLDVTDNVDKDGSKLQVWTCGPRDMAQKFAFTTDGTIQWSGGGNNKCVDITDGNLSNGNQVQIWTCDKNNSNQKFKSIPVNFPVWFTVELDHIAGNCITAANATNAPVTVSTCTQEATGQIITDPDHNGRMVMYDDLCVTPAGNTIADGAKLVLAPCDADNKMQLWNHRTGSVTSKANAGFCFDLPNGNTTPGTQLQIWSCFSGNTNQEWVESDHWSLNW